MPILQVVAAFPCSDLLSETYRTPVPDAGPLDQDETVGRLAARYLDQTAALAISNGRTSDVISIVQKCDSRAAAVAKALTPQPWWKPLAFWRR